MILTGNSRYSRSENSNRLRGFDIAVSHASIGISLMSSGTRASDGDGARTGQGGRCEDQEGERKEVPRAHRDI